MAEGTLRVHGLKELNRSLKQIQSDLKPELETELRLVGQIVAEDARNRFDVYDSRSAAGFRPRLRGFGSVVVEQRRKRTTGQHPEFGSLQMRKALIPAVWSNQDKVMAGMELMLDRLGNKGGF